MSSPNPIGSSVGVNALAARFQQGAVHNSRGMEKARPGEEIAEAGRKTVSASAQIFAAKDAASRAVGANVRGETRKATVATVAKAAEVPAQQAEVAEKPDKPPKPAKEVETAADGEAEGTGSPGTASPEVATQAEVLVDAPPQKPPKPAYISMETTTAPVLPSEDSYVDTLVSLGGLFERSVTFAYTGTKISEIEFAAERYDVVELKLPVDKITQE